MVLSPHEPWGTTNQKNDQFVIHAQAGTRYCKDLDSGSRDCVVIHFIVISTEGRNLYD
jgi:hypothetical protein